MATQDACQKNEIVALRLEELTAVRCPINLGHSLKAIQYVGDVFLRLVLGPQLGLVESDGESEVQTHTSRGHRSVVFDLGFRAAVHGARLEHDGFPGGQFRTRHPSGKSL